MPGCAPRRTIRTATYGSAAPAIRICRPPTKLSPNPINRRCCRSCATGRSARHSASHNRTVGLYLGALGFGYNTEDIKKRKLTPPACWADLIKPEFKGEVQMADPNSSGTAWTMLATIVQLMGEDKGFDYLKALNRNINEYTKAGAAPALAAGQGETLIGIAFQHDVIDVAEHHKPVAVVSPCEGTGYEIGSLSLVAGAKHMDEAKQVLRLGTDAGGAEARRRHRKLPDPLQSCDSGAAGGA